MITLTARAVNRIHAIMTESKKPVLRLTVQGGGCSGLLYNMRLEHAKSFADTVLEIVPFGVFEVITDKKSAPFLDGLSLDFEDGLNGQGFKYTNPNAKGTCGCGSSFKV